MENAVKSISQPSCKLPMFLLEPSSGSTSLKFLWFESPTRTKIPMHFNNSSTLLIKIGIGWNPPGKIRR